MAKQQLSQEHLNLIMALRCTSMKTQGKGQLLYTYNTAHKWQPQHAISHFIYHPICLNLYRDHPC